MISDGEVPSDVVPTAWCHQLTNYTIALLLLLRTVTAAAAHPPPEVATLEVSVAPVTQRRQSANRKDERIHCRSSSGVYLPWGRSWRALLRLRSQTVLSKFRALFFLAVAASKPKIQARSTSFRGVKRFMRLSGSAWRGSPR